MRSNWLIDARQMHTCFYRSVNRINSTRSATQTNHVFSDVDSVWKCTLKKYLLRFRITTRYILNTGFLHNNTIFQIWLIRKAKLWLLSSTLTINSKIFRSEWLLQIASIYFYQFKIFERSIVSVIHKCKKMSNYNSKWS